MYSLSGFQIGRRVNVADVAALPFWLGTAPPHKHHNRKYVDAFLLLEHSNASDKQNETHVQGHEIVLACYRQQPTVVDVGGLSTL